MGTKKLNIELLIASSVWSADVLTVTTTTAHDLVTNDLVDIFAGNGPESLIKVPVTVIDPVKFSVPCTQPYSYRTGRVVKDFVRSGFVGRLVFTVPRSTGASAVIQSFVTGTGGATYNLDASLDGVHWVTLSTILHGTIDGDIKFYVVEPAWTYFSADVTSIGANTKLELLYTA